MKKIFIEDNPFALRRAEGLSRRVFIVTGELSGDKVGAWYLRQPGILEKDTRVEAVGGDFLQAAGADIYERFEQLNVTGIVEIVCRLPSILKFLKKLTQRIIDQQCTEVVLVDFPGFNLRLARLLKQHSKNIKITYLSPPQLWCWGQWRITKLKKYTDQIIVLYPFEVDWYKQRGVSAHWLGSPVYDRLQPYFEKTSVKKKRIAIIPGSRIAELENMFSLFAALIKKIMTMYVDIEVVIPLAESLPANFVQQKMQNEGLDVYADRISLVYGEEHKLKALSSCCLAVTKPGTVTLELALLGVPTVMMFKTSWINYCLARFLVKVDHMALPNLLMPQPIYKEFLQYECRLDLVFDEVAQLYESFVHDSAYYHNTRQKLVDVKNMLSKT